jgi:hypothetical protein
MVLEAWGLREGGVRGEGGGFCRGRLYESGGGHPSVRHCYDPCCRDRKISVVDMGLIESITIRGRKVRIEMVLTTGWCPFASRLLEMVEEEVGGLSEVDNLEVEGRLGSYVDPGEDERLGT